MKPNKAIKSTSTKSASTTMASSTDRQGYVTPTVTVVPFKQVGRLSWGSGCDPTTYTEGSYIK
jgi:hypothetical protein